MPSSPITATVEFLQRVEVSYTHTQPTLEQSIVTAASGKISYNDATSVSPSPVFWTPLLGMPSKLFQG